MTKRTFLLTLAVSGLMAMPVGVAQAAEPETIEPTATNPPVNVGGTLAQSFRPTTSGQITEVTLWAGRVVPTDEADRLRVFAGPDFGTEIGTESFVWTGSPQVVRLTTPIDVTAGSDYLIRPSEIGATSAFMSTTDPYENGEAHFLIDGGWTAWTALIGCRADSASCPPLHLDLRLRIVIEDVDADGDGVVDHADLCPDTVLPERPSRGIGTKRFAATQEGFVGADGSVVRTLAETGGCSAFQIIDAMHLGEGHKKHGITRPHLNAWVALTAAVAAID